MYVEDVNDYVLRTVLEFLWESGKRSNIPTIPQLDICVYVALAVVNLAGVQYLYFLLPFCPKLT